MKKTLCGMLGCMLLTSFVCIISCFDVYAAGGTTAENMYIDNVYYDISLGEDIDKLEEAGWKWDAINKELVLNGYNGGSILVEEGDLDIRIDGENTVLLKNAAKGTAISVEGDLNIYETEDETEDILNITSNEELTSLNMKGIDGWTSLYGGTLNVVLKDEENASQLTGIRTAYVYNDAKLNIDVRGRYAMTGVTTLYAYGSGKITISAYTSASLYSVGVSQLRVEDSTSEITISATSDYESTQEYEDVIAINSLYGNLGEGGTLKTTGLVCGTGLGKYGTITEPEEYSIYKSKVMGVSSGKREQYTFCTPDGEPLQSMKIENTGEAVPLAFVDGARWDIPEGKVGEDISTDELRYGLKGYYSELSAPANYSFALKEGSSLPTGLKMNTYGRIYGTYEEECEAGTVTIVATTGIAESEETPLETIEFEIAYGAVTEADKFIVIGEESYNMNEDASGDGWQYQADGNKLILSGYYGDKIASDKELNIYLDGENTVLLKNAASGAAISVEGDLNIYETEDETEDILNITSNEELTSLNMKGIDGWTSLYGGTLNVVLKDEENASQLIGIRTAYVYNDAKLNIDVRGRYAMTGVTTLYACGSGKITISAYTSASLYSVGVSQLRVEDSTSEITISATSDYESTQEYEDVIAIDSLYGNLGEGGTLKTTGLVCGTGLGKYGTVTEPEEYSIYKSKVMGVSSGKREQYTFCTPDGEPLQSMQIENTGEAVSFAFMDGARWDIPEGKVGEDISTDELRYGLKGYYSELSAPANYSFALKEGSSLPTGLKMNKYGRIYGTYEEECEAGTVTIVATTGIAGSEETPLETIEFGIAYGAVTVKNPVTGILLSDNEIYMKKNETVDLTVTVQPEDATVNTYTCEYKKGGIVYYSSGVITAIRAGMDTITFITDQGKLSASCTVYVKEDTPEGYIWNGYIKGLVVNDKYLIDGEEFTIDGYQGVPVRTEWAGKTLEIIKVNEDAECNSDPQYLEVVTAPITDADVSLDQEIYYYNGEEIQPYVTVKVADDTLTKDEDYTLQYDNNRELGMGIVTITGIGKYTESIQKEFQIRLRSPEIAVSNDDASGKPVITWTTVQGAMEYELQRSLFETDGFETIANLSDNHYADNAAEAKENYYYRVCAVREEEKSEYAAASVISKLAKVTGLKAVNVAASGKPKLTWTAVQGADKYEVYRSTEQDGSYSKIYTTKNATFTNTGAAAEKKYYYKVCAISVDNSDANGAVCDTVSIVCDLAKVTGLKAVNVAASGKPKLTWTAVQGADKYEVYRSTEQNGTYSKIYTTKNTTYTNTGATAEKKYYYKVRAISTDNSNAHGALSGYVVRTCDLARPVISVTRNSAGKPKITWAKVKGADKYEIYRSTKQNGTYSKIYTTKNTTYINTKAAAGKTYYYKVRAISTSNSGAHSAYSTVKKCTSK